MEPSKSNMRVHIFLCSTFLRVQIKVRDTFGLKEQLEKNENLEIFKLESFKLKNLLLSWEVSIEVGKFSIAVLSDQKCPNSESNIPTSFNFIKNFPTVLFQLPFPTKCIPKLLFNQSLAFI